MSAAKPGSPLVLAIHPNAKGFGWIAVRGVFTPERWGTVRVREKEPKNATCLARAERLFKRLPVSTLVLEEASDKASKRAPRIRRLVRGLAELAAAHGIEVATYPYRDVQAVFSVVGARTRHEIAEAASLYDPVLRKRLPKRRREWETENERLAIFCAAALILTHDRLAADRILDALA